MGVDWNDLDTMTAWFQFSTGCVVVCGGVSAAWTDKTWETIDIIAFANPT